MKILKPKVETVFFVPESGENVEVLLERIGRISHKSDGRIKEGSAPKFIRKLKELGHGAALEFGYFLAFITCDRGVSHELVRHRLASFLQESTRYCNYSKGKFNGELTFIEPENLTAEQREIWLGTMEVLESDYLELAEAGAKPDVARAVLPNCLKTEIVCAANIREWMHIFHMRCAKNAHPQIRWITKEILKEAVKRYPTLYADEYQRFVDNP